MMERLYPREERLTSLDYWEGILDRNPEIDLVKVFAYFPPGSGFRPPLSEKIPRKRTGDYKRVDNFREQLIDWKHGEARRKGESVGRTNFILGIGSTVGIGIAQEEEFEFVISGGREDWELVKDFEPVRERSFLFADFKIPCSDETTEVLSKPIQEMGIRADLFWTGASYHLVSDVLTPLDQLPSRYGELINAFARTHPDWGWAREIGDALLEVEDLADIKRVCHYILDTFIGEDYNFPLSLEFIGFSLLEEPVLRISSKRIKGELPFRVAKFEGRRSEGLENIRNIISESDVFPWMESPAPKSV